MKKQIFIIKSIFLGSLLIINNSLFADVCNNTAEHTLRGYSCPTINNYNFLASYVSFKANSDIVNTVGCYYQQTSGKKSPMTTYETGDGIMFLADDTKRIINPNGVWKRYDLKDSATGVDRIYVCGNNISIKELNYQQRSGNPPYKIEDCQTISNYTVLNAANVNFSVAMPSDTRFPLLIKCYSDDKEDKEVTCSTGNDLLQRQPILTQKSKNMSVPIDKSVRFISIKWCDGSNVSDSCNWADTTQAIPAGVSITQDVDNKLITCAYGS